MWNILLSIRKTSVPKKLRKEFTDILKEDVLEPKKIDLKSIIKKYDNLGVSIKESLEIGSTEYLLPKNLEVIDSYKTPAQIEAVRAAIIWNALEPENQIVPPDKIDIIKLRPELIEPLSQLQTLDQLQEFMQLNAKTLPVELVNLYKQYPNKVKSLAKVIYRVDNPNKSAIDISHFGLSCVAIPKGEDKIPDYLIPFIDYDAMVNNNMTNGYIILESLGIYVEEVKTTKYKSNIIAI